jgi:hypothetical protein
MCLLALAAARVAAASNSTRSFSNGIQLWFKADRPPTFTRAVANRQHLTDQTTPGIRGVIPDE